VLANLDISSRVSVLSLIVEFSFLVTNGFANVGKSNGSFLERFSISCCGRTK